MRDRHHYLLKTGEIAADLNCAVKKVWQLIHDRHLQAVNITPNGNRPTYRVDPADLEAFKKKYLKTPHREQQRRKRVQSEDGVIAFMK